MNGKLIWSIFGALVGVFIVVAGMIFIGAPIFGRLEASALFHALFVGTIALFGLSMVGLGVALIVLTLRKKVGGRLKKFFLLTGASASGVIVSAFLHNVIYALFIYFFGTDFWTRVGIEDEPFFFIMATLVCPLAFLVGAVGSIVLGFKNYRLAGKSPPSSQQS